MHILLNASNVHKGGPLQRLVSLLGEIARDARGIHWTLAVSDVLMKEIKNDPLMCKLDLTPLQSPARSTTARRALRRFADTSGADAVFSFAGPTYVPFRQPHILGCADGWLTHSTARAYRTLSVPFELLGIASSSWYKRRFLRWADRWIVQTQTAARGLSSRLAISPDQIHVVPNACAQRYLVAGEQRSDPPSDVWTALCFAASYPHKRLDLVPEVAAAWRIQYPQRDLRFVMTLPSESKLWRRIDHHASRLGVRAMLTNAGPVAVGDGPDLYRACHVSFVPTVFETSTAVYPESMAMGRPIVTSDLDFAHDACGVAAEYFPPEDAAGAATALHAVLSQTAHYNRLVTAGREHVQAMPTQTEIYQMCVQIVTDCVESNG